MPRHHNGNNKSVLKCITGGKSPVSGPNNSHTHSTNSECQYTPGTVLGAGHNGAQDRKALCSWSSYSSGRENRKDIVQDHYHEEKKGNDSKCLVHRLLLKE